jgi:hypothetical protein
MLSPLGLGFLDLGFMKNASKALAQSVFYAFTARCGLSNLSRSRH